MCDCDDYPPEFYNANMVKGRKVHRCDECLRDIPKGELHEYACGKWEGRFDSFRTCGLCMDVREAMDLDCWSHGLLMDDVSMGDYDDHPQVLAFNERRRANYDRITSPERLAVNT